MYLSHVIAALREKYCVKAADLSGADRSARSSSAFLLLDSPGVALHESSSE